MKSRQLGLIEGVVQGVGFRPFVVRLARELQLCGFVRNEGQAARIEVEGAPPEVRNFVDRLARELPLPARIERARWQSQDARGDADFRIEESREGGARELTIPPDLATCRACFAEIADPAERRHRYPFTNCTRCGPRFSIARGLPYDRERTSMTAFTMCDACGREYTDLADRRYHAQPIACPRCGPRLRLTGANDETLSDDETALRDACEAIRRGEIVALKGIGGFQLWVDATSARAVSRLRDRKQRPEKPFAVMVRDLAAARELAQIDAAEQDALSSAAAPIVLCRARAGRLAPGVAPGEARLGLMLPTSPLHLLMLDALGVPVVCTSGNARAEPIAKSHAEALQQLRAIADLWLTHDREIVHRIDDAVVHVADGRARVLRLGRGFGPVQFAVAHARAGVLCTGAHLNNAPAATLDGEVVLWPHVGDLDTPQAEDAFAVATVELASFMRVAPSCVVSDAHPEYASSRWAETSVLPRLAVHHHHAHVAACLAEHAVDEALGVVWDGVGLGPDGGAWGGEFLHVSPRGSRRVAHLRAFPLPGGDAAARDGRRALAGLCVEADFPAPRVAAPFGRLARSQRFAPRTTSAGRLFDAVSAWLGIRERSSYEGQAATALEQCACAGGEPYPFRLDGAVLDWTPMLPALNRDLADPVLAASRFHGTLVAMIVAVAEREPYATVALAGGCMQNVLLVEQVSAALRARGKRVLLAERAPVGDGGIALGQAWVACHARASHAPPHAPTP